MRIAIIHYHLEPGGVTSVIAAGAEVLDIPHVILSGGDLSYRQGPLSQRSGGGELQTLLADLRAAASSALGGLPDVWHFHNPTLGKNDLFPALLTELAEAGEKLVLHIHDLAEDGRPQNYQKVPPVYPIGPHIHYAFINEVDRQHFIRAGLPETSATLVHNPVPTRNGFKQPRPGQNPPLLFAPIRGIRRKNLGELILLSSLLPEGAGIAISRAPQNPEWLKVHDDWQHFAAELHLPIAFDVVSEDAPFEQWIELATHFVGTSIAEGFGLPFLESLTYRRPIIGRDLSPKSCADAANLYQKILVPREWLDLEMLRCHLARSLSHTWKSYGRQLPPDAIDHAFQHLFHGDFLDFGNLPESFQKQVILHPDRVSLKVETRSRILPLKQWLDETLRDSPDLPSLSDIHSPTAHAAQLMQIYQKIHYSTASRTSYLDREKILSAYLTPGNFHFLRASLPPIRAIIFDLYGTLLLAPPGAVKHDPTADAGILHILGRDLSPKGPVVAGQESIFPGAPFTQISTKQSEHDSMPIGGYKVSTAGRLGTGVPAFSPTLLLYQAVQRQHARSAADFPEIDLRELWREILQLPPDADVDALIAETEKLWHPSKLMPGAAEMLDALAAKSVPLGILSNAQHHSLAALGNYASHFSRDLTFLSYQHGIAKPSPALFQKLRDALTQRGILPEHVLFIGNDPIQDIRPAAAAGFQTALFTGHPDSFRSGDCKPDFTLTDWRELVI